MCCYQRTAHGTSASEGDANMFLSNKDYFVGPPQVIWLVLCFSDMSRLLG